MDRKDFFWNRKNNYGLFLDEYGQNIKIVEGKRGDQADYLTWGWPQVWKNKRWEPDEIKRPIGVYFGDKERAIEALEYFLRVLKGEEEPAEVNDVKEPF